MTITTTMIPHSRPSIEPEDIRAVTAVLQSGHLAQGAVVEQFERGMAAYVGVAGGVAVNSGTMALEVALRVLDIGPGDEVLLPSYVCAAPWQAVQRVGAQARLVDIDPETFQIDAALARAAITSKTRAIIVPHLFGLPADLTALAQLGVPLIEDCAQTLGAMEQGRSVGSVGVLTVCSFYANKLLCAGEGGMVLSNDPVLLERARALREYDGAPSLNPQATNLKMTDLQAAVGLAQLNRLPELLARRVSLAQSYREALAGSSAILPVVPGGRSHVYYRFVVRISKTRPGSDELSECLGRLERQGVQCRKPVFRSLHRYLGLDGFPASEAAEEEALSVPLYPDLTGEEAAQVCMVMRDEWRRE
ncbi:DegT/DnrJ/EryC1/StrS family aminotransferase [Nitrospira lenta]|uniref:Putative UDP-4-amino-4-deoxy-L-arabinose--oxoglutarate aminotransferase n=1 Tax=Nitrospira lenta TaxID=1436998 RepID=A0A330LBN8_9BACT|nr:DegT/DnrJ/EryC1/StrS family aminotransferase [Nitrospira lenta]SPP66496.1 putative UDP-4-amino-4-deoxy-L-arabinose--oxoglutarate aminotransferase [Nitrospira lenta]